jgi:dihydroneopterin aldolase/2-amino-4-hydroxy-6-hydroxymethyldihydropteridine diphosphokinase/dihydropteroate synthase
LTCHVSSTCSTKLQATSSSAFLTLEALASHAAQTALQLLNSASDTVFIAASKPSAIVGAQCAKVSITRRLADYGPAASEPSPLGSLGALLLTLDDATAHPVGLHLAAIAIGSNLGDRFANIEEALRLLEDAELLASLNDFEKPVLRIVDTSFLYETAPMYVTDQPDFINGACLVRGLPCSFIYSSLTM